MIGEQPTSHERVESTDIFFSVINALDFAGMICDKDMNITSCTSSFASLLELPEDLFETGRNAEKILKLIYDRNDQGLSNRRYDLNNRLDADKSAPLPLTLSSRSLVHTRSDGKIVEFTRVYTAADQIVTIGRIITERAKRDKLLNLALASAEAGHWSYSFITKRYTFSSYLQRMMTDAEIAQAEQNGFWDILHPDDSEKLREVWNHAFETNTPVDHTFRVVLSKSGVRTLRNVGYIDHADNGKPIGVTSYVSDITTAVEAQNALQSAKAQSEHALRSSKEFLAHMSHEIRTPMNGVLGMTEALIHNGNAKNISKELGIIQTSAKHLLRVLDDTLDHAKLAADRIVIHKDPANIPRMLDRIHQLWKDRAAQNNTKLSLAIEQDFPQALYIDSFRVEQCLNNIISNAVKFTSNGNIHIIAKIAKPEGQASQIILAVKDDGIGMSAEQQKHVYTAYKQAGSDTHVKYGGTGLGMSIVKDLARLMGGRIQFKSVENVGTTFLLSLPHEEHGVQHLSKAALESAPEPTQAEVLPDAAQQAEPEHKEDDIVAVSPVETSTQPIAVTELEAEELSLKPSPAPTTELKPSNEIRESHAPYASQTASEPPSTPETVESEKHEEQVHTSKTLTAALFEVEVSPFEVLSDLTVLVAEDNETNQIVVGALLEPLVKKTIFAGNGKEALEVLDSHPVDVVLMDIHMPIMDGIESTLSIRTSDKPWRNVPIIALTADPEYQQLRICRNIGMNEALSKPVSRSELVTAFTSILNDQEQALTQMQASG